jgi:hypothetical protein
MSKNTISRHATVPLSGRTGDWGRGDGVCRMKEIYQSRRYIWCFLIMSYLNMYFLKFLCPSWHSFCLFCNDTGGRESELGTLISKFNIHRSYPFI